MEGLTFVGAYNRNKKNTFKTSYSCIGRNIQNKESLRWDYNPGEGAHCWMYFWFTGG